MKTTCTPHNRCPFCRYEVSAASSITGGYRAKTGDYSVCLNCGNLLRFKPDLTVRESSVREFLDDGEVSLRDRQRLLRARVMIQRRGPLATKSELSVFRPN